MSTKTDKEKAKAYDEAYKIAEGIHRFSSNPAEIKRMEDLFPELAENEDERIIKNIISWLKNIDGQTIPINDYNSALAWLEKQYEQKPDNNIIPIFKTGNVIKNKKNGDTVTIEEIDEKHQLYCYKGWNGAATIHSDFSISEQDDWELVEKKELKKIEDEEPSEIRKHLRDIIVKNFPVVNIDNHIYLRIDDESLDKASEELLELAKKELEKTYVLWRIDRLNAAEPDVEHRGVCQESEDEKMLNKVIEDIIKLAGPYVCYHKDVDWLKSLKNKIQPQYAWSEEDEEMRLDAIKYLEIFDAQGIHGDKAIPAINWLKSLKERVQPQPKQEWSEEDEDAIGQAIVALEDMYEEDHPQSCYAGYKLPFIDAAERLKSLRPQNHWKPSDGQMEALSKINITGCISYTGQGQELVTLYHDLKKLKENKL